MTKTASAWLFAVATLVATAGPAESPSATPGAAAAGKVEALSIPSRVYGRGRRVWVYTPPEYAARSGSASMAGCDFLIAFDGGEYLEDIPLSRILDALLAKREAGPFIAVLIDNATSAERLADLANHARFVEFLADEVVSWARQRWKVTRDPHRTIVTGSSAGGLAAVYAAFERPDIFGNVISQSGAFWRGNEGSKGAPYEWLTGGSRPPRNGTCASCSRSARARRRARWAARPRQSSRRIAGSGTSCSGRDTRSPTRRSPAAAMGRSSGGSGCPEPLLGRRRRPAPPDRLLRSFPGLRGSGGANVNPESMRLRGVPFCLLWLALGAAAAACRTKAGLAADTAPGLALRASPDLRVARGEFRQALTLTGELEAAKANSIPVPRVPSWQVSLQWLETDGITVKKDQRVAEIDNTAFVNNLKEKETAAVQAEHELAREEADQAGQIAEKEFQLERKRKDLEKAKIEAALPAEFRSRREHQEKQLAFEKATVETAKAETELRASRTAAEADVANRRLALEKARGDIETARRAIQSSTLRAPRDGILIIADHPWEGRKLQVGDQIWVGRSIASIPDMTTLQFAAFLFDVDDGRCRVGQDTELTLDAYPDLRFPGRIEEVAPVAQESSSGSLRRGFRVVASLARLDPKRMRPGLSGRLTVLGELRRDALLIPRAAVDFSTTPPRARTRDGSSFAVRLGRCNAAACIVEEGATAGTLLSLSPAGERER